MVWGHLGSKSTKNVFFSGPTRGGGLFVMGQNHEESHKNRKKQFFQNKPLKVILKSNSDAIFGIYVKFGSPPVFFKKIVGGV